jgi:protein-S-isoprenylcysteine O-methyltransferase Ste14
LTTDPYCWLHLAGLASVVFPAYWFASALKLKTVKQREARDARLVQVAFTAVAYALVFNDAFGRGWLGTRFLPASEALGRTGFALAMLGVAFAIWARWHLGENWSGTVTLKEGRELVRSGPYWYIHHSIYTGMLLGFAGTVLALREYRGFVSFAIAILSSHSKAKKEERLLAQEFGESFREHARRTGMFLPSLGGPS